MAKKKPAVFMVRSAPHVACCAGNGFVGLAVGEPAWDSRSFHANSMAFCVQVAVFG